MTTGTRMAAGEPGLDHADQQRAAERGDEQVHRQHEQARPAAHAAQVGDRQQHQEPRQSGSVYGSSAGTTETTAPTPAAIATATLST